MHFLEVLYALTARVAGTDLPDDAQALLVHKLRKVVPVLQPGVEVRGHAVNHWAALRIQRALREWLARRRALIRQRTLARHSAQSEYWSCSEDEGEGSSSREGLQRL